MNGNYVYTLYTQAENPAGCAAVQALDNGQHLTEVFDYRVTDGDGDQSTASLTITINGTNDAPVAQADTNWAKEDGVSATGNVLLTLAHNGAPSGSFTDLADTDADLETLTVTNIQDVDSGRWRLPQGRRRRTGR